DPDQAREILTHVPEDKANDPDVASVRTALDFVGKADAVAENDELGQKVAANPSDGQARYEYAEALPARGDFQGAADQSLAIIEKDRDWNEGAARAQLLKVFEAAGPASDVAKQGRRRLSAILFS